jgi:hypothetical protein
LWMWVWVWMGAELGMMSGLGWKFRSGWVEREEVRGMACHGPLAVGQGVACWARGGWKRL